MRVSIYVSNHISQFECDHECEFVCESVCVCCTGTLLNVSEEVGDRQSSSLEVESTQSALEGDLKVVAILNGPFSSGGQK